MNCIFCSKIVVDLKTYQCPKCATFYYRNEEKELRCWQFIVLNFRGKGISYQIIRNLQNNYTELIQINPNPRQVLHTFPGPNILTPSNIHQKLSLILAFQ
jgi:hypothetical protein